MRFARKSLPSGELLSVAYHETFRGVLENLAPQHGLVTAHEPPADPVGVRGQECPNPS